MSTFIYKITNKVNGKAYIGLTTQTVKERWRQHVAKALRPSVAQTGAFGFAIVKYGPLSFIVETLWEGPNEELDEQERLWIQYYRTLDKKYGYNLNPGGRQSGNGPMKGQRQKTIRARTNPKSKGLPK